MEYRSYKPMDPHLKFIGRAIYITLLLFTVVHLFRAGVFFIPQITLQFPQIGAIPPAIILLPFLLKNSSILFIRTRSQIGLIRREFRGPFITFQSSVSFQIFNFQGDMKTLLNYVHNTKRKNLGVTVVFSPTGNTETYLTLSAKSFFRPYSPIKLAQSLSTITKAAGYRYTEQSKKPQFKTMYYYHSIKHLRSLNRLSESLTRNTLEQNFAIELYFDKKWSDINPGFTLAFMANSKEDLKSTASEVAKSFISASQSSKEKVNYLEPEMLHELMVLPYISDADVLQSESRTEEESVDKFFKIFNISVSDYVPVKSDFRLGALIVGAIGTGKTTMRLNILKNLINQNVNIIDIDLKGDSARYNVFQSQCVIYRPGVNLCINLFELPEGTTQSEYADSLYRALVDSVDSSMEFTPPQRQILRDAISSTIEMNGTPKDFFENIFVESYKSSQIISNKQEATGLALYTRFAWMQTTLGSVFWHSKSNITGNDLVSTNSVIDLSSLYERVPVHLIRFLVDLILQRFTMALKGFDEVTDHSDAPKYMVSIDEGQLLVPRRRNVDSFSRLEEIISTLRYKGVSVLISGVKAELMSNVAMDSGFICQFRSESTELFRALALQEDQMAILPKLPNYHAFLKSPSTSHLAQLNKSSPLNEEKFSEKEYSLIMESYRETGYLKEFSLSGEVHRKIQLIAETGFSCPRPLKSFIEEDVEMIVSQINPLSINLVVENHKFVVGNLVSILEQIISSTEISIASINSPEKFSEHLALELTARLLFLADNLKSTDLKTANLVIMNRLKLLKSIYNISLSKIKSISEQKIYH